MDFIPNMNLKKYLAGIISSISSFTVDELAKVSR